MRNPGTGNDDAKFFSLVLAASHHLAPGAQRDRTEERALAHLIRVVKRDKAVREGCRDSELVAAIRVRCWGA